MGGKAFSNRDPPLHVPRLSDVDFSYLCAKYISQLLQIFERVDVPTPAPDKSTHGDIDILVGGPKPWAMADVISASNRLPQQQSPSDVQRLLKKRLQQFPQPIQAAAIVLQAHDVIFNGADQPANFAIAHPDGTHAFVQVDVRVCADDFAFDWLLFLETHGDFWLIAGRPLGHVGLTVTDKGLWVRDAGIEREAWNAARFHLTDDPRFVLKLLALDGPTFWCPEGFESRDAMFEFLGAMRFFSVEAFAENGEEGGMNAKERKRRESRPLYRRFCEEWVPRQAAKLASGAAPARADVSRDEVRDAALAFFGKREEWERWRAAWWEEFWRKLIETAVKRQQKEERRREVAYADAWISALEG